MAIILPTPSSHPVWTVSGTRSEDHDGEHAPTSSSPRLRSTTALILCETQDFQCSELICLGYGRYGRVHGLDRT